MRKIYMPGFAKQTGWWVRAVIWSYFLFILFVYLFMFIGGDRCWPATIIMYGPRWVVSFPLSILIPLAVCFNRRLLVLLFFGSLIVFGPFMGFCLPAGGIRNSDNSVLRVLTYNLQSSNNNASMIDTLIQDTEADVVALQECPRDIQSEVPQGWYFLWSNGLAVFSKYPLELNKVVKFVQAPNEWSSTLMLLSTIRAPGGGIAFGSVHLPSPRFGLKSFFKKDMGDFFLRRDRLAAETEFRRRSAESVYRVVASVNLPIIIAGDFNMPTDSTIYRQYFNESVNAFSQVGFGYGWTVQNEVFGVKNVARVDHIIVGAGLEVQRCKTVSDRGSDHLPLIAEVVRR